MIRAWLPALLSAVLLAGCAQAPSPASSAQGTTEAAASVPVAPSSLTPSPTVAPTPTPAPTASPTPTPTPTIAPLTTEEMAALYLAAATKANNADDDALAKWKKSSKSLKATRTLYKRWAAATLGFIQDVQAVAWNGDAKGVARRLLACNNQVYVNDKNASAQTSWFWLNSYGRKADNKSVECSGIANEIRMLLGLPPVG